MEPGSFVSLGRVMKSQGLKGEVALAPAGDLPFVLPEGLEVWFVPPPSTLRFSRVESVRMGPRGPVIKVAGVDNIDDAKHLVGRELLARSEDLPSTWGEVEEDFDPIGYIVTDESRGLLGEVTELIVTGANDVWVVEGPFGEVLLPVIDQVVLEIDEDACTARVRLLPGLIDGEDQ